MLITLRSTTLEWHQKIKYSNPLYDQELQVGTYVMKWTDY